MNKLLFFLALSLAAIEVFPQSIANYATVRNTGITYSSISGTGSAFNNWRNISSFTQDDNRSDFTDIGFDFWYNGTRYTQFCVSTNGFIDFSNSTDDGGPVADDFGYDNTAFTNATVANATRPAITPFYDDLTAQGGTAALGNGIKYLVTGSAPNRTLTIEWINMAVYLNTTPSLNFQVQLVEGTGKIFINYGTMITGTQVFSYGMGINSATLTNPPTAAQLKMLQAVNGTVLNNTVQNNLSAMPASNSQYIFTPPVPTPTAGTLSFSGISQSSMTLTWSNWASNEVGYVIYYSTDGINYSFAAQTAANAVSANITGLISNTNYFWKIHAVTEGCLSDPIYGTQATSTAGTRASVVSGNWNSAATWSPSGIPSPGEDVTISNGHVVSITSTANCNSLRVGQGSSATLQFSGTTARSFTVNNDVDIFANGVFNVQTTSNVTHSLVVKGNITNNGTLDFASDANSLCNTTVTRNGNQDLTGTGPLTRFNLLKVDLGTSNANIFNIATTNFTAATNFLTLKNGTFKLSVVNAVNLTPFSIANTIPQSAGIWLNSAASILNTGAGITLIGKITVDSGTLNIGNAANEDLLSSGGRLSVSGGQVNIAGKYYATGINNLCYFSLTGGTVTVPNSGSTNQTTAPFQIIGAGSQFNMTGGFLVIPREGGNGAQDLGFVNTVQSGTVTGGTLQVGNSNTPANQTISINTNYSVGNLLVNSANATAKIITNSLSVVNDVTINSGTLNVNNLNLALGGNWTRNTGGFIPGSAIVTFSSSTAQSISTTGGETFNHLLFAGSGIKTFSTDVTSSGNFSVAAGSNVDVSPSDFQLTIKGNYLNNGSFNARNGLVHFNGTTAQTIGGSSITDFYDITLGNAAGASLSAAENLLGTLTLTTGVFNTNSNVFTMVSTATACARIAQITGSGDITGNVTVQRFAPGGTTGWALMGTPISSALTLNDWDDDIPISCPTCPDGSAGGFLSIYTYNESASGFYDDYYSYVPLSTINDAISSSKGYWVYLGLAQYTTAPITLDVTGTVRKFNNTIPLNYTNYGSAIDDGWNLIQNPYPSPISWSALKGTTSNIDDAIYIYNADLNGGSGGYATYVNGISSPAISSGGVGNTIPMSQAFYVHSTGATALNATEAIKVAGNPAYLKTSSTNNTLSLLRLSLKSAAGYDDETILYIQPGAIDGFDYGYDAYKMRGQDPNAPSIALEKNVDLFQVNGVAPINGNFVMPLKTLTGYSGSYTISASNFTTFPAGACINLFDKFTNTTTNLKTNNYVFNLADTTTVARFDLKITINPLTVNANINQPTCQSINGGSIVASGTSSGPWNFYWTLNGTAVKTSLNKNVADTLLNLTSGTYDLEMNTAGLCDNNYSSYQVIPQAATNAQFISPDTLNLNQISAVSFTNLSTGASAYSWNFGDGSGTSALSAPVYNYTNAGTYSVQLITTSSSGCTDTTGKVITALYLNSVGINYTALNNSGLVLKTLGDNEFIFEQSFNGEQHLHFALYDSWGRLIKDFGDISSSNLHLPVDLKMLPVGVYVMRITSGKEQKTVKLPVK